MRWRPIKTAPKEGQFLAYSKPRKTVYQVFRHDHAGDGRVWVVDQWTGYSFTAAHWLPLPVEPPE